MRTHDEWAEIWKDVLSSTPKFILQLPANETKENYGDEVTSVERYVCIDPLG
jgi:hypothetical protein